MGGVDDDSVDTSEEEEAEEESGGVSDVNERSDALEAFFGTTDDDDEDETLADLREYGSGRAREETDPSTSIYITQDADDIDTYGLFDILDLEKAAGWISRRLQYINTGSVGLVREYFYDAYDNKVIRYYTTASSDAGPSKDPPSIDSAGEVTYSSTETAALKSRFGADIGNTTSDLYAYLENFMSELTAEIAGTQLRPRFTFKKIKAETLDSDILSSFVETEKAQTVTTGLTVTEEVSAETDESGY